MVEVPPAQEDIQICSKDSLKELYKKENRVLFIATDEKRKGFAQKFVNEIAPKDLPIFDVRTDSSCEVVEHLELKDKPTAVLIENGEVKTRMNLTSDDMKDTANLTRMILEKTDNKTCIANLRVDRKGWELKPEPSPPCERELSNLSKLPPAAKKYLKKHLK